MLIQVKHKELKELRQKWYNEQNGFCPILKEYMSFSESCMDHQHKLKAEIADESGKGILRGCINRVVNSFLGKVENAYKRYGLHHYMELSTLLRSCADYLDNNRIHFSTKYIHPNEAPKKVKLKKSSYNKLRKVSSLKMPVYTGSYTARLKSLFDKYNISPEFYS